MCVCAMQKRVLPRARPVCVCASSEIGPLTSVFRGKAATHSTCRRSSQCQNGDDDDNNNSSSDSHNSSNNILSVSFA